MRNRYTTEKVLDQPPVHFHSLVWLIWLAAGFSTVTSNPLLNVLIMLQAVLVGLTCHSGSPVGHALGLFLKFGLILVIIRTLLSVVAIGGYSYGSTKLFTLPTLQLPIWLGGIQLGGTATLEMLIGGLVGGLRLWALLLLFGAFNAVADHYALLRRTPRFLFHAGLVTTIALTFVPHAVLQLQAIRDAQRIRGHRFRSWRDALPLLIPLVSGSLERSIQLAEALDSRGFGRIASRQGRTGWSQAAIVVGLTLIAYGLYFGLLGNTYAWFALVCGGLLAAYALHRLSLGVTRTRYVQERWHRHDTMVAVASVVLMSGMIGLRLTDTGGLLYTPLPQANMPSFDPFVGVLLLLLSLPTAVQLITIERLDERPSVRRSQVADRP